jgi:sugar/nucleoside kinase (ribokinase family)
MVRGRIVVIGSSDTDLIVRTERLPRIGETVIGGVQSSLPTKLLDLIDILTPNETEAMELTAAHTPEAAVPGSTNGQRGYVEARSGAMAGDT